MKVTLDWLREFVDWRGTADELTGLLTRTGIEVADVETRGVDIPHVVTARIVESVRHPNADRLSVGKVDDGSGSPRQIVCGAKNYAVGDIVPLALPGAVLPGDFTIKVGKLRGVESEGMMCSARELGMGDDAAGLWILPEGTPVGVALAEIFPPVTVFDLELTPNRGDWQSVIGIAREVAAFGGGTFKVPDGGTCDVPAAEEAAIARDRGVAVVEAAAFCPFYSVRRIRGVRVGASPGWMRRRLESVGLRAINTVVDVTNYVMLERGQPLHAFDAARVNGTIRVREAVDGEAIAALDGRTHPLEPGDGVIADDSSVLALAGVMGGVASGVSEATTDVLLESAWFDPSRVRRVARRLDLHSDSSHRFERGVDPGGVLAAMERAVGLILSLCGGEADPFVDGVGAAPSGPSDIVLRRGRCAAVLGIDPGDDRVKRALTGLGLVLRSGDGDASVWGVPSFRADLVREIDLIEEVARVIGIEAIPGRVGGAPAAPGDADAAYDFAMETRRRLVGLGLHEARTGTLVSDGDPGAVVLRNPLGTDQSRLRGSLVPGLLDALARNVRLGAARIALFEIGRVFSVSGETTQAAFVLTGPSRDPNWLDPSPVSYGWAHARGVIEAVLRRTVELRRQSSDGCFAVTAEMVIDGTRVGRLGLLSPAEQRSLGAGGAVVVGEWDLAAVRPTAVGSGFSEPAKFPVVTRDLAVVVAQKTPFEDVTAAVRGAGESLLRTVTLFDVFVDPDGVKLPVDRKSLAISLTFQAPDRTLSADEVHASIGRIREKLQSELAAEFRE